jgi:elongation factor P hydroxylase
VIDYGRGQFIIELKLWYGEAEHEAAYEQLAGYLRSKNADRGYLVTFDLRKPQNRQPKEEWVSCEGVRIFDVVL